MKEKISMTIIIVVAIAAVGVAGFIEAERAIRFSAIDACLRTGTARFTNVAKQDVTVPDTFWYEFCMKEKGLK